MPCVREVATRSARPALASQAEKASRSIGEVEKLDESNWSVHSENAMNRESIIPSRQRRADRRWTRLKARPISPRIKVEEKAKCTGVIRGSWTLTTIF